MAGARGLLINITGGDDMTLFEVDQAANRIREEVAEDANIIFGSAVDDSLSGRVRVSVVATGIDMQAEKAAETATHRATPSWQCRADKPARAAFVRRSPAAAARARCRSAARTPPSLMSRSKTPTPWPTSALSPRSSRRRLGRPRARRRLSSPQPVVEADPEPIATPAHRPSIFNLVTGQVPREPVSPPAEEAPDLRDNRRGETRSIVEPKPPIVEITSTGERSGSRSIGNPGFPAAASILERGDLSQAAQNLLQIQGVTL